MRYVLIAAISVLLIAACTDDDDDGGSDLAKQLGEVCAVTDAADTENIVVTDPAEGDEVTSPLVVTGEIEAFQGRFWISAVTADGGRIIDYPATSRDLEEGVLSPFEVSVPFTVGEETPVCVWVYRRNVEEPEDAIRVPVLFVPADAPEEEKA